MSDKKELFVARLCAGLAVLVGVYFGINPPGFIVETVALAFSIASSAFFPALVLGIFSKRINKQGAIAGMLSGLMFSVGYIIYFQFMGGKETQGRILDGYFSTGYRCCRCDFEFWYHFSSKCFLSSTAYRSSGHGGEDTVSYGQFLKFMGFTPIPSQSS